MSSSTPNPAIVLAQEFDYLIKNHPQYVLTKQEHQQQSYAEILLSWLQTNTNYTASFWTQTNDVGDHPLAMFINSWHPITSAHLLDRMVSMCGDNALALINTPNPQGKVLLHMLWERWWATSLNTSGNISPALLSGFSNMLALTHPRHWTFLDAPGQPPGHGMTQVLLSHLHAQQDEAIQKKMVDLIVQINPVPSAAHSWDPQQWLDVNSSQGVEALLALGGSLSDLVTIGNLKVPAWKWLIKKDRQARYGSYGGLSQWIVDKKLSKDERKAFEEDKAVQASWDKKLVPKDRRATKGYVLKVLETEGLSPSGQSGLDYLLQERSDLFEKFDEMTDGWSNEQLTNQFNLTNQWGQTALDRILCRHQGLSSQVLDWAERRRLDWKTSILDQGVFCFPIGPRHHSNDGVFDIQSVAHLAKRSYFNPHPHMAHVFFGPPSQQHEWSRQWEGYLQHLQNTLSSSDMKQTWSLLPKHQRKTIMLQLGMLAANPAWREHLDPTLSAQLSLGALIMLAGAPPRQEVLSEHKFWTAAVPCPPDPSQAHLYPKHVPMTFLEAKASEWMPTNHWTPAMLEIIHSAKWINPSAADKVGMFLEQWKASANHHELTTTVAAAEQASSSALKRRM